MQPRRVKTLFLVAVATIAGSVALADVSLAQPATLLQSVLLPGALPITDPESPLWDQAQPVTIPLAGQGTVEPMRLQPSTPEVAVRVLMNGTHVVFRIDWVDDTLNNRTIRNEEFRDAVALMFTTTTLPGICMGSRGQLVNIVHWKADWQADIDEGFRDLQHAFPNFWVDHYPFAIGDPPYSLPDAFPEEARELLVGWAVGNPFSQPVKATPVEDARAQGFGTIATQDSQDVFGRGVWSGSSWTVLISRRLDTGDPEDLAFAPGGQYFIGAAVWDGDEGDVGARKSVSSWTTLQLAAPEGVNLLLLGLVMIPPAVGLAFAWYIFRRRRHA